MKSGLASQPQIKHHEFKAISELVLRQAGIALAPHKRELVVARLSGRLRELGLRSFGDYYERVQQDAAELAQMVDRITTHETRFFREARHFALLEEDIAGFELGEQIGEGNITSFHRLNHRLKLVQGVFKRKCGGSWSFHGSR